MSDLPYPLAAGTPASGAQVVADIEQAEANAQGASDAVGSAASAAAAVLADIPTPAQIGAFAIANGALASTPAAVFGALSGQVVSGAIAGRLVEITTGMGGMKPNDSTKAAANITAWNNLAAYAATIRANVIRFEPAGLYYMGAEQIATLLLVNGITWPFVVDMTGSTIMYDPTVATYPPDAIIESSNNSNITWLGLRWDYTIRPSCQGTVTAFSNTANTITFLPDAGFLPTQTFACIVDCANPAERAITATIGSTDSGNYAVAANGDGTYTVSLGAGRTVDPSNAYNAVSVLGLSVGSRIVVRHSKYQTAGFASTNDGIVRADTTCIASTGLANRIVGSVDCEITCKFQPPTGGYVASNADGLNVSNVRGPFRATVSGFGIGDDACNVRGQLWAITSSTTNSVTGQFGAPGGGAGYDGYPFEPNVGDVANFYDPYTGEEAYLTVEAVVDQGAGPAPSRILQVIFTAPLPADYTIGGYAVFDQTQMPTTANIAINTSGYVVGRGAVIQASNVNLTINTFGTMYEGFIIGQPGAEYASEIAQPSSVTVEGSITNCAYFRGASPVPSIAPVMAAQIIPAIPGTVHIKRLTIQRSGLGGINIKGATVDIGDVSMSDVGRLRGAADTTAVASGNELFVSGSKVTVGGMRKLDGGGRIMIDSTSQVQVNPPAIMGFALQTGSSQPVVPTPIAGSGLTL